MYEGYVDDYYEELKKRDPNFGMGHIPGHKKIEHPYANLTAREVPEFHDTIDEIYKWLRDEFGFFDRLVGGFDFEFQIKEDLRFQLDRYTQSKPFHGDSGWDFYNLKKLMYDDFFDGYNIPRSVDFAVEQCKGYQKGFDLKNGCHFPDEYYDKRFKKPVRKYYGNDNDFYPTEDPRQWPAIEEAKNIKTVVKLIKNSENSHFLERLDPDIYIDTSAPWDLNPFDRIGSWKRHHADHPFLARFPPEEFFEIKPWVSCKPQNTYIDPAFKKAMALLPYLDKKKEPEATGLDEHSNQASEQPNQSLDTKGADMAIGKETDNYDLTMDPKTYAPSVNPNSPHYQDELKEAADFNRKWFIHQKEIEQKNKYHRVIHKLCTTYRNEDEISKLFIMKNEFKCSELEALYFISEYNRLEGYKHGNNRVFFRIDTKEADIFFGGNMRLITPPIISAAGHMCINAGIREYITQGLKNATNLRYGLHKIPIHEVYQPDFKDVNVEVKPGSFMPFYDGYRREVEYDNGRMLVDPDFNQVMKAFEDTNESKKERQVREMDQNIMTNIQNNQGLLTPAQQQQQQWSQQQSLNQPMQQSSLNNPMNQSMHQQQQANGQATNQNPFQQLMHPTDQQTQWANALAYPTFHQMGIFGMHSMQPMQQPMHHPMNHMGMNGMGMNGMPLQNMQPFAQNFNNNMVSPGAGVVGHQEGAAFQNNELARQVGYNVMNQPREYSKDEVKYLTFPKQLEERMTKYHLKSQKFLDWFKETTDAMSNKEQVTPEDLFAFLSYKLPTYDGNEEELFEHISRMISRFFPNAEGVQNYLNNIYLPNTDIKQLNSSQLITALIYKELLISKAIRQKIAELKHYEDELKEREKKVREREEKAASYNLDQNFDKFKELFKYSCSNFKKGLLPDPQTLVKMYDDAGGYGDIAKVFIEEMEYHFKMCKILRDYGIIEKVGDLEKGVEYFEKLIKFFEKDTPELKRDYARLAELEERAKEFEAEKAKLEAEKNLLLDHIQELKANQSNQPCSNLKEKTMSTNNTNSKPLPEDLKQSILDVAAEDAIETLLKESVKSYSNASHLPEELKQAITQKLNKIIVDEQRKKEKEVKSIFEREQSINAKMAEAFKGFDPTPSVKPASITDDELSPEMKAVQEMAKAYQEGLKKLEEDHKELRKSLEDAKNHGGSGWFGTTVTTQDIAETAVATAAVAAAGYGVYKAWEYFFGDE